LVSLFDFTYCAFAIKGTEIKRKNMKRFMI